MQRVQFDFPRHPIPFGLGEFPFLIFLVNKGNGLWCMIVKNWEKNQDKKWLRGLQMLQFECPRHWGGRGFHSISELTSRNGRLRREPPTNMQRFCSVPSHVVCVSSFTPRITYQVLLVIRFAYQGNCLEKLLSAYASTVNPATKKFSSSLKYFFRTL